LFISVVIATLNRVDLLARTLPSVIEQDYPSSSFEIVLVDDGSSDGTANWARSINPRCQLSVIEQANQGPAAARNVGIAEATGDIILFLDDDIMCDRQLLAEHAAAHTAESGGLVHGSLYVARGSPDTLAAYMTNRWYERHHRAVSEGGLRPDRNVYLNANSSLRADLLRELGGFDQAIPFPREDFELGLRIWKAHIPLRYHPRARAYEVFLKPSAGFVRDARGHARADLAICDKHPDYRPHSGLAPADPPRLASMAARTLFRRLPNSSERLLAPPLRIAERQIRRPLMRAIGLRLLAAQRQIVFDRAASEATGSAAALEQRFVRWLPTLLYHRVGGAVPGLHPDLTVSPATFERHLAWLKRRGYSSIRASQWQDWRMGRATLPPKPILITFDDGYADLAQHALPILFDHGYSATIFLVTRRLGMANDWDAAAQSSRLPRLLTADEVTTWSRLGVEFGSHSRTHRNLCGVPEREIDEELAGSQADLERLVGKPVVGFAYPFGQHNSAVRATVAKNFDIAFTADAGLNGLGTPPHALRRSPAGRHDSGPELEWRAWAGAVPLHRTRDVLRVRAHLGLAGSS
jgi:peptidoglycan/xylan/chitin deacetylase (PgdA/CDA1 family)